MLEDIADRGRDRAGPARDIGPAEAQRADAQPGEEVVIASGRCVAAYRWSRGGDPRRPPANARSSRAAGRAARRSHLTEEPTCRQAPAPARNARAPAAGGGQRRVT